MKTFIEQLAHKYEYDGISQRLVDLDNAPSIRIGFIGEFSAGKSSLINSILGIHLPTNIAPTTKAICLIEPTVGLESNRYFKENGAIREPIEFAQFRNILRGEEDSTAAVIQVPPCEVLPTGCVFVDTPGIHTATGNEAELTKAYLSMLDAAVVCINITNGVINKDLLDFLCNEQLRHLQKHLVFALTWSDRKSPEEGERVRSSIVQLLKKTIQEGRLTMDNLDAKVFTISAMEQGNAEKLYGILKSAVLEDLPALHEQRKKQVLNSIGQDLLALLNDRVRATEYDDSQLNQESAKVQQELKTLQVELRKREGKMEDFNYSLIERVRNLLSSHMPMIAQASDEGARADMIATMNDELNSMLKSEAQSYLGITTFGGAGLGSLGMEIEAKLKNIEAIKDMAVTASTAIATAWIIPGGALAGNAAQAAGGAVARGAATAAATKAAAGAVVGTFGKILGGVGSALKAINPLEHIGTMVANYAKKNAMESLVDEKSASIAASFIYSLETPFQNEVLKPLEDKLEGKRKQLASLQDKGREAFEEFRQQREQTRNEIAKLESMLAG